jgi:DNA-binding HxlR family transcriptional regulator
VRHSKSSERGSPYSYTGLHRVIHERARLSVLTSLAVYPKGLRFAELKQLSGLTDGNLSRHLQVLVTSKLVEISKTFEGNRPQTFCKLTALGRKRYAEYVLVLERVVKDATAIRTATGKRSSNLI